MNVRVRQNQNSWFFLETFLALGVTILLISDKGSTRRWFKQNWWAPYIAKPHKANLNRRFTKEYGFPDAPPLARNRMNSSGIMGPFIVLHLTQAGTRLPNSFPPPTSRDQVVHVPRAGPVVSREGPVARGQHAAVEALPASFVKNLQEFSVAVPHRCFRDERILRGSSRRAGSSIEILKFNLLTHQLEINMRGLLQTTTRVSVQ